MEKTFHIFTDGSVIGNPGPGGWAAVLMGGEQELGDLGIKAVDDHLGDGATGSRRGIAPIPAGVSCPALL